MSVQQILQAARILVDFIMISEACENGSDSRTLLDIKTYSQSGERMVRENHIIFCLAVKIGEKKIENKLLLPERYHNQICN